MFGSQFRINWFRWVFRLYWCFVIQFWYLLPHLWYWMHLFPLNFSCVSRIHSIFVLNGLILFGSVLRWMRWHTVLNCIRILWTHLTFRSLCKIWHCSLSIILTISCLMQRFSCTNQLSFLIILRTHCWRIFDWLTSLIRFGSHTFGSVRSYSRQHGSFVSVAVSETLFKGN